MKISIDDWMNFTRKLSKLNAEASELVQDYAVENGLDDPELLDYAYGVVLRYGEASAALSAEMYDEIARLEGKILPDAEVAETPTKNEVAKAVNGTKKTGNPKNVGNAVGRLVKRTGADTMLKNAARDGAQFAWIPSGDTCPFCLMLASNGWQYMSKKALKNGHAEHIHANCDCTYCIRFDKNFQVEGYDPDKYLEMYYAADGATIEEKANSIRRQMYAQNKDKINAQKRANYAEKKELAISGNSDKIKLKMNTDEKARNIKSEVYGEEVIDIDEKFINSEEYRAKFVGLTGKEDVDEKVYEYCKEILKERTGTELETLILVDLDDGSPILTIKGTKPFEITYSEEQEKIIKQAKDEKRRILSIHNHPTGSPPSADDSVSAKIKGYEKGITCGHNASLYVFNPSEVDYSMEECDEIHSIIEEDTQFEQDGKKILTIWKKTLEDFGIKIRERR